MIILAPFLLSLAFQDPAIETLVLQLDDEDIRRREAAVRDLSDYGESALTALGPALVQSSLEGRLRAQDAVDRIQRELRIRRVLTEPEMVDLRCKDKPLEDILLLLGRKTGLSLTLAPGLGKRRITVTKATMTTMESLDAVCAQAGCEWSYLTPRIVTLRDGKPSPAPAAYEGRFRFTLPHVEKFTSMCGDVPSDTLCLRVKADHEHGVAPIMPPAMIIERVVDDAGGVLVPEAETPPWVTAPFHIEEALGDPEHSFRSPPLLVAGFAPGMRRIASISGYALYEFALAEDAVDVPHIDTMAWVQQGSLEIGVFAPQAGAVEIRIQSADGAPLGRGALNIGGIRIVDTDGVEHRASYQSIIVTDHSTPEASCLHYTILFDEYGQSHARSIHLPLVTERYEKRVPFAFSDIPLPRP